MLWKEFIERYIISHQTEKQQSRQQKKYVPRNLEIPRLIVDLQNCIKAQKNRYCAQKVKLGNLKAMAKTISYLQERGISSIEELQ